MVQNFSTFCCTQARCQDLAARGTKNQKEGPKTRRGGHILKTLYWMYAAARGPNVKWGAQISNGGGHHWLPRWRRSWLYPLSRSENFGKFFKYVERFF